LTAAFSFRLLTVSLLAALVLSLIPLGWPAGFYLLASTVFLYLLTAVKLTIEMVGWEDSKRVLRLAAFNVTKGLRDTVACITAGVLIVYTAQILLRGVFVVVSEDTVRALELNLVQANVFLSNHLKLNWIIGALLTFLLLQTIWPNRLSVAHFKRVRIWAGRVLVILTVVCSFSFLAEKTIPALEKDWVAQRKDEFGKYVGKLKQARIELVTDAYWLEQLNKLPPQSKVQLRIYFTAAADDSLNDKAIAWLAEQIRNKSPVLDDIKNVDPDPPSQGPSGPTKPSDPTGNGGPGRVVHEDDASELAVDRVAEWIDAPETKRVDPPSLDDGGLVKLEAQRIETLTYLSRTMLENAVKSIIGEAIPGNLNPLVSSFVKSLESSVVSTSFKVLPRKVNSIERAANWVKRNVFEQHMATDWIWSVPAYSAYTRTLELEHEAREAEEHRLSIARKVDRLVPFLECNIEENRIAAADALGKLGPELTNEQIAKIASFLDDGRSKVVLTNNGWFKYKRPVSYYAARALVGMELRALSPSLAARATEIFKQYDPPGPISIASTLDRAIGGS
jgi:hypothetical protein